MTGETGRIQNWRYDRTIKQGDGYRSRKIWFSFLSSRGAFRCLVHTGINSRHTSNNTNVPSHATLRWSWSHTPVQHTDINHSYKLEGNTAVYFPQGSSSAVLSQHSHLVNVVSYPETEVLLLQGVDLCMCWVKRQSSHFLKWGPAKTLETSKILPFVNRSFDYFS